MIDPDPASIPAATLILFRDRPGGSAELLFVERSRSMAFAPGAIVFPGGRVDPGDEALAASLPSPPADAAARIAAIRETIEETGVPVGVPTAAAASIRSNLAAGQPLGQALAAIAIDPDLSALVPFARWRPSHRPTRIFDTRFYLARAPADVVAMPDGGENVRLFWATAASVLAQADAGQVTLIFPTRRNLERLALLPTYAMACDHARRHPVRLISPWIEARGGIDHLCLPDDAGYPVTSEPIGLVDRG